MATTDSATNVNAASPGNPNASLTFTTSNAQIQELLTLTQEISDLSALASLAAWDQETQLPEGASQVRGQQFATIEGLVHQRIVNPRIGELVNALVDTVQQPDYSDAD